MPQSRGYEEILPKDASGEVTMIDILKFALSILLAFAIGVCASHALFDAMSAEQEAREATLAQQIDTCKVGNYCKLNGQGFLKMSGRKE